MLISFKLPIAYLGVRSLIRIFNLCLGYQIDIVDYRKKSYLGHWWRGNSYTYPFALKECSILYQMEWVHFFMSIPQTEFLGRNVLITNRNCRNKLLACRVYSSSQPTNILDFTCCGKCMHDTLLDLLSYTQKHNIWYWFDYLREHFEQVLLFLQKRNSNYFNYLENRGVHNNPL